jgi:hypothetical protein
MSEQQFIIRKPNGDAYVVTAIDEMDALETVGLLNDGSWVVEPYADNCVISGRKMEGFEFSRRNLLRKGRLFDMQVAPFGAVSKAQGGYSRTDDDRRCLL